MATRQNIRVAQGHTHAFDLYWETSPIVRIPITTITCPLGAARIELQTPITVPSGWRVAVVNVQQPREINAEDTNKIRDDEYYAATVLGPTTIELTSCNIGDMKPYTTDGFIQYNTPVDLTGVSVRFRFYSRKGGTLLASNVAGDAPLDTLQATIDAATKKISLTVPSTASATLAGKSGWYDVEAVSSDAVPVVTQLVYGTFTVEKE